ncbi:MAG: serine/threonine protein kinase [Desulfobacterales bacterium]|nr:serine/threonine protein kinase [Desulfobacterales bacterium]
MNDNKNILKVGMILDDRYIILEFIGKGGMGEVYRAHQLNLNRDVAIKIISQEWLKTFEGDEEEIECALDRFQREVEVMAQVRHPNVVQIYDYGSALVQKDEEELVVKYIAMEYIPGATLGFTMSDEGFSPDEDAIKTWLVDYFLSVLDGVQAMHKLGIVHRDLKPGNILLDDTTPKIADFGIARSCRLTPVTRSIDVKGSPLYMSPEHFMDLKRTDTRADIYSLGKILYEAIDGKISSETIPFKSARLSNSETPFLKALDKITSTATAEDREERLESVKKFRDALLEAIESSKGKQEPDDATTLERSSTLSHSKKTWAAVAATIVLIAALALWHVRAESGKTLLDPRSSHMPSQALVKSNPSGTSKARSAFPLTDPNKQSQRWEGYPNCDW